jgi:hypothetical protein
MQAWESPIIRVTSGALNNCNDTVVGGTPSIGTLSRFAGQLGKVLYVSQDQIATLTKTSIGTLYGGGFRYVRRRATDDDSPALAPGKLAFIDTVVANWESAYQVTTDENLSSTSNAMMLAGVFLNNIEPGNYGFIQIIGQVAIRFRSVLTASGAIGGPVYAAAAGDTGADQGTADSLTTDSTALANSRYLGNAVAQPTGGSLTNVILAQPKMLAWG